MTQGRRSASAPRDIARADGQQACRGLVVKAGALGLSPLAAAYQGPGASRYRPKAYGNPGRSSTRSELEASSLRYARPRLVTTSAVRTTLRWRYFEGPFRSEATFYVTGLPDRPTHYAIVRYLPHCDSAQKARILDIFGDFGDSEGLADLLRTIVRDAAVRGSSHRSKPSLPGPC